MRILPVGLAATAAASAAVVLLAVGPGAGAAPQHSAGPSRTAAATSTSGHARTVRTTVRPVTSAGRAASGFTVHDQDNVTLDCGKNFALPSPGAVNRNIVECSPSAAYAIACWKSASPKRVLCMRDPQSHDVYQMRRSDGFPSSQPPRRSQRAPLLLVLADGARCSIRDGGAWGSLKSHPRWNGSYSCSRHGVVWAAPKDRHYGVDESHPVWTVKTAPFNGRHVVTRHVRRAYFVGTAQG